MNGEMDRGLGVLAGVLIGALAGAGVALLLAPTTGPETRRKFADTARRLASGLGDIVEQTKGKLGGMHAEHNADEQSGAWEATSRVGY